MGVGPGDPSLLTLAAVEAIRKAEVVAYPVGRLGADSMAAKIAAAWIRNDHQRLPMLFPMVEAAEPRRTAWEQRRRSCSRPSVLASRWHCCVREMRRCLRAAATCCWPFVRRGPTVPSA